MSKKKTKKNWDNQNKDKWKTAEMVAPAQQFRSLMSKELIKQHILRKKQRFSFKENYYICGAEPTISAK